MSLPKGVNLAWFAQRPRAVRDHLRTELQLVRWEDRGVTTMACENVHRIKGLETDCVILAGTVALAARDQGG